MLKDAGAEHSAVAKPFQRLPIYAYETYRLRPSEY
jgi:hypothetical protein